MIDFKINQANLDLLTQNVKVDYSFCIGTEQKTISMEFENLYSYQKYINGSKRDWFLGCLENWVNHKKHIIEGGKHQEQIPALNICNQALNHYQKIETDKIFKLFLKGFSYFEKLLPNPQNHSFETSQQDLQKLKSFAKENQL